MCNRQLVVQSNTQELEWLNGTSVTSISEMHREDGEFLEIPDAHIIELETSSLAICTPHKDLAFVIDGVVISGNDPQFDAHYVAAIGNGGCVNPDG